MTAKASSGITLRIAGASAVESAAKSNPPKQNAAKNKVATAISLREIDIVGLLAAKNSIGLQTVRYDARSFYSRQTPAASI
jgi:hypothetical protein